MRIRAHHLLCFSRAYCKKGWYNRRLTDFVSKILYKINKTPDLKVEIVKKCDDICKKCPHRKNKICKKEDKINYWIVVMDNKVLRKLKIKPNSIYNIKELVKLTAEKISNKELRKICRGCDFLNYCLKYGLNKSFIQKLKWPESKVLYTLKDYIKYNPPGVASCNAGTLLNS